MFVTRKIDSDYGPIELAITRAEHISVQGHPVIRDTKFDCHLHFWRQMDGTYAVREQDRPNLTRAWMDGMKSGDYGKSAPPTYLAKVIVAYTEAVNTLMAANPELAEAAEQEDIERETARAEAALQEAQDNLNKAKAALLKVRSRLNGQKCA